MGIFHVEMRVIGREDDVVFQAEVGKVFRHHFVVFDGAPARLNGTPGNVGGGGAVLTITKLAVAVVAHSFELLGC